MTTTHHAFACRLLIVAGALRLATACEEPIEEPPAPTFELTGCGDVSAGGERQLVLDATGQPEGSATWSLSATFAAGGPGVLAGTHNAGAVFKAIRAGSVTVSVQWSASGASGSPDSDSCTITVNAVAPGDPIPGPTCTTSVPPVGVEIYAPAGGQVCAAEGLLGDADGGAVTGLARLPTDDLIELDGVYVSSCARVDFGEPVAALQVRVVARGVQEICGDGCVDDVCATGDNFITFVSGDGVTYSSLGNTDVTAELGAYAIDIDAALGSTRYALVCRSGNGHGRDNIAVDYVELCR